MHWNEIKEKYTDEHLAKPLKNPQRRLNALSVIEGILQDHYPEMITDAHNIAGFDKGDFAEMIRKYKVSGKISSADKSVISGIYKIINNNI